MTKPNQKTLNEAEALNRSYIVPEIVRQRQRTLEALDIKKGEHVLDVGCGTGFLTCEMALIVGQSGRVLGIDPSQEMVDSTLQRCSGLEQVESRVAEANSIPGEDQQFDVATCTQVLLYVEDVPGALAGIHRALKPGGRLAVLETDWRGIVLATMNNELSRRIVDAWDATTASPNLPPQLGGLLRRAGFNAIRCEAIPLLNTSYTPHSYSYNAIDWLAKNAYKQGAVTREEGTAWTEELARLGDEDEYFFCLNRFLFVAVK